MRHVFLLAALIYAVSACDRCAECDPGLQYTCSYSEDWLKDYQSDQFDPTWMQTARSVSLYDSRGVCAVAFRVPTSSHVTNVKFVPKSPGLPAVEVPATCEEYFSSSTSTPTGLACEAVLPTCILDPIGIDASIHGPVGTLAEVKFQRSTQEGPGDRMDLKSLKSHFGVVCPPSFDDHIEKRAYVIYTGNLTVQPRPPIEVNIDKGVAESLPSGWVWVRRNGRLACVGGLDCFFTFQFDPYPAEDGNAAHSTISAALAAIGDLQIRWRGVSGELVEFQDYVVTSVHPLQLVVKETDATAEPDASSASDVVDGWEGADQ